jgi:hypothetical protein
MMWNFFGRNDTSSKRPAEADAMTPPRSGIAKKLNQNKTPTWEDDAERAVRMAEQAVVAAPLPLAAPPPVVAPPSPPVVAPPSPVVAPPPPVSTQKGLRSMAATHKERDLIMKGANMCCLPVGPYKTEDDMIAAVQAWAGKKEAAVGGSNYEDIQGRSET